MRWRDIFDSTKYILGTITVDQEMGDEVDIIWMKWPLILNLY